MTFIPFTISKRKRHCNHVHITEITIHNLLISTLRNIGIFLTTMSTFHTEKLLTRQTNKSNVFLCKGTWASLGHELYLRS